MRHPIVPLLVLLWAAAAEAQTTNVLDDQPAARHTVSGEVMTGSMRTATGHLLIMPEGFELGGELVFVTADGGLGGGELKLTDVGLLRLGGRISFDGALELIVGATLLPKQPTNTDNPVYQGASLGVRFGLGESWAVHLGGRQGPLLEGAGYWGDLGAGLETKTSVDETLDFTGGLATSFGMINPDGSAKTFWLAELTLHGEVQLKAPNGAAAVLLGAAYSIPYAHRDLADYDPQQRLDLHVTGIYGFVPKWDLYVDYAFIDRGDLSDPKTTFPVLDGGFDQRQLTIGLIYRPGKPKPRW